MSNALNMYILDVDVICKHILNIDIIFKHILDIDGICKHILNIDVIWRHILDIEVICKHILNISFLNKSEPLNSFKYFYIAVTIQHQFICFQTVLFDRWIGPSQERPLCVRVVMGAMAMKGTSNSPNHKGWYLTIRWFNVISRALAGGGFLPLCSDAVGVFYTTCRLG